MVSRNSDSGKKTFINTLSVIEKGIIERILFNTKRLCFLL